MPLSIRVTTLRRGDRATLERWVRSRTTPQRLFERACIVLASADGCAHRVWTAKDNGLEGRWCLS